MLSTSVSESPRRNGALLVALLGTQLLLMSNSVKRRDGTSLLESWIVSATSPIVTAASWVGDGLRNAADWSGGVVRARARNVELEAEVLRLQSELRGMREAARENTRLRELLGMRGDIVPASVGASMVTANLGGSDRLLVVDRGTRDGVQPDLPVVSSGAVVGKIVAAYPGRAKVRLITDPNSGVAGVIQRSRAHGIVFGTGGPDLRLRYVARFSDVVVGDRVVTSSADGIFPRGFGIGTVRSVEERPDGTQEILLDAELDFTRTEEVLVLLESAGGGIETPDLAEPR